MKLLTYCKIKDFLLLLLDWGLSSIFMRRLIHCGSRWNRTNSLMSPNFSFVGMRKVCRSCGTEEVEKTVFQLMCQCSALARNRRRFLASFLLESLTVLAKVYQVGFLFGTVNAPFPCLVQCIWQIRLEAANRTGMSPRKIERWYYNVPKCWPKWDPLRLLAEFAT